MRSIFFFISLFSPVFVFSQFNITCLKLTDTTKNIFYIGVDNPIRVSTPKNLSSYQIEIEIEDAGGSLTKTGLNEYIVRVTATGTCSITIKQKSKQVFQKEFKVEVIAEPVTTLSGIKDITVSKNRILLNPFLSIIIPNFYFQSYYQIVSFTATFINGVDSIPTMAIGNLLSKEQVRLVKEASSGNKIYFDNIRGNGPDGRTRKFPPFWIKIQ